MTRVGRGTGVATEIFPLKEVQEETSQPIGDWSQILCSVNREVEIGRVSSAYFGHILGEGGFGVFNLLC